MREIFKEIPGYDGRYQVSNLGRVKSMPKFIDNGYGGYISNEKIIRQHKNQAGYYNVKMRLNNHTFTEQVHQIMAIAFLNHKPNGQKLVVDHIDNNPENNYLNNLQIITQRENSSKDKKNGTSKHTGVCWNSNRKLWMAAIRINGKKRHLGYFEDENRAKISYDFAVFQVNKLEKLFT